jgi:hypothetical protein
MPLVGKVNVVAWDSQYAVFCHPQSSRLLAVMLLARLTSRPDVVFIRYAGLPPTSASEN